MAGWMRNWCRFRHPINLKWDLWINLNNASFYKKIMFHKPALMPHSTTKQTIWTINQCGISSNLTLHYQKVLQISLWIQKQVWCKQSLICQSSVEAMGMAVWAVKLKTHKKTVCQQQKKNKKKTLSREKQQWSLKCIPGCVTPPPSLVPFPSLPMLTSQVEPMRETPKADRGTSAIWSKLLPKRPTEEQSKNPVAVLSWEKKLKQFYEVKNMVATNQFFQLGIEVCISW